MVGIVTGLFYSPKQGLGKANLGTIQGAKRVCGFYSPNDKDRHAIVATSAGEIVEIFYGADGSGQNQIATFRDLVDVAGFYSPNDQVRHVIVAENDGTVTEVYYQKGKPVSQVSLASQPGITKIAGFYTSSNDPYSRRVLMLIKPPAVAPPCAIAAPAGDFLLDEIRYSSPNRSVTTQLLELNNAIDVGGCYSSDDDYSHALYCFAPSQITEFFYIA